MIRNDSQQTLQDSDLLEQINSLKREDEMLYNILAVDVWALAKTMDECHPGFWAAFMKNREQALKRFLDHMMQSNRKRMKSDVPRHPFLG